MGRASSNKQGTARREKVAAQREAERKAHQRNRMMLGGGVVLLVVVIVAILVTAKLLARPLAGPAVAVPAGPALRPVVAKVTSVPPATLEAIGAGNTTASPPLIRAGGAGLSAGGKPEVLYMGAEYCPYCAAERWPMVVALSRFGTFSGLAASHSAAQNGAGQAEPFPDTPTFTFHGSTYTSRYLTFTPVEMSTNIPDPATGGYTTLQTPTPAQRALLAKYDAPPYVSTSSAGSIPFVNFASQYVISGASYDPGVLSGLTWSQIAGDLSSRSSPVAKAVNGAANFITAAVCKLTGNQPATVCTAPIRSLQAQF